MTGSVAGSSRAAWGSSATATSPASDRRSRSTQTGWPTTRRATSSRWCTSPVRYARQRNRLSTFACTSSVGPGATNMVTGAALATVNRLPVLLLPGDTFATRGPHPVLQQLEVPADATVSVNDAFRPVSRFYERVERPEQLYEAALSAMRVLTDPAETGAVTLALPEDVQAEAFDVDRRVPGPACVAVVSPAAGARGAGAGGGADPGGSAAADRRRGRGDLRRGARGVAAVRRRHRHPGGRDPGGTGLAGLLAPAVARRRGRHRNRRRQSAGPGGRRGDRRRHPLGGLHDRVQVRVPGSRRAFRQRQRRRVRRGEAERLAAARRRPGGS